MIPIHRVRPASLPDIHAAAELAAELVRFHHRLDPQRFAILAADIAAGYERYLSGRLADPNFVALVAERCTADGTSTIVGYAYGEVVGRNWNDLLDVHGRLHDVFVDSSHRRNGFGATLVTELVRQLEGRGAPRTVLTTAHANAAAQRLFIRLGFRPTMIEMTRDAEESD